MRPCWKETLADVVCHEGSWPGTGEAASLHGWQDGQSETLVSKSVLESSRMLL